MRYTHNKTFDQIVHPYIFILQEGKEIQTDFLDYSLLLLQVGQPDVLYSPQSKKPSTPVIQVLKNKISLAK